MKKIYVLIFTIIFVLFSSIVCLGANQSLKVSWEYYTDTDATEFILYSSETQGGPYTELLTLPHVEGQINYTDQFQMTVAENTDKTYYFVMTAKDGSGNESEYSIEDSIDIDVQAPETVFNLTVEIVVQ